MLSSKRGVAPLIATVFLIALFISIGAVLMNLGTGMVEGAGCQATMFQAIEQDICYDGSEVRFGFRNTGTESITGVTIQLVGSDGGKQQTIDMVLDGGATAQSSISFSEAQYGALDSVMFTPLIEGQTCSQNRITLASLPSCS